MPAVHEHRRIAERQDQSGHAAGQIRPPLHRHQGVDERGVVAAEPVGLASLRVRCHHKPHRLQRFDEEGPDAGARFADRLDALRELRSHAPQRPDAGRHRRDADEREPRVEPEHRADAAGEEQHVARPREQRFGRDALNLADVVVHAREDVAERRARVEPRRQLLQMTVEREPHVEQDVRRHARVAETGERRQREAGDRGQREQADDAVQRAQIAPDERAVHERLRQIRQHQRQRRADEAERCDQRQTPPVGHDIRQGAAERWVHIKVLWVRKVL